MATEENDQWGRGLTFPNTSVHRLLSITPIAAVPFVRTSKAYKKYNGEVRYSGGVTYIARQNVF